MTIKEAKFILSHFPDDMPYGQPENVQGIVIQLLLENKKLKEENDNLNKRLSFYQNLIRKEVDEIRELAKSLIENDPMLKKAKDELDHSQDDYDDFYDNDASY